MTMKQYIQKHEENIGRNIEYRDKRLLKQLAPNTLFCSHCYRPILTSRSTEKIKRAMSTEFESLLEYTSAILFVVIPIVWIPLILLFAALALKEKITKILAKENRHGPRDYRHFDREY